MSKCGFIGRLKTKKMNKKFASLGTALSRDEAKKIMGGNYCELQTEGCTCTCSVTIPGSWYYTGGAQPSDGYLKSEIATYCGGAGQGTFTGCTNWV